METMNQFLQDKYPLLHLDQDNRCYQLLKDPDNKTIQIKNHKICWISKTDALKTRGSKESRGMKSNPR